MCVPSSPFLCTNVASASPPSSAASPNRWNILKYAIVNVLIEATAFAGYTSYGSFSFVSILLFISIFGFVFYLFGAQAIITKENNAIKHVGKELYQISCFLHFLILKFKCL